MYGSMYSHRRRVVQSADYVHHTQLGMQWWNTSHFLVHTYVHATYAHKRTQLQILQACRVDIKVKGEQERRYDILFSVACQ